MNAEELRERAAEQERRDERATVLLKRVGIGLLVMLVVWIPIVVWSFAR